MLIKTLLTRLKESSFIAIKQGKETLTYKNWYKESKRISRIIDNYAFCDSITIGILLPNSLNYAISYFAILFSNKIIVPININSKKDELLSTIHYCEMDIIISDSSYKKDILYYTKMYKYKITIYFIDTNEVVIINEEKMCVEKSDNLFVNETEQDVVIMLHTSGTTDKPKRVMLTNKNLVCNICSNIESLKLSRDDKLLIALPMFFGYCNTAQFLTSVYLGATIVLMNELFLPKNFFRLVESEKISAFTAVPSMLLMILAASDTNKYNLSSLRYICFGGGTMPNKELERLIKRFPTIGFVQTYGQTECSPRVTALLPEYSLKKIGSVGKPIPNVKVEIFDKNDNILNSNNIGEIVVQGNNIMKGYFKRTKTTNNVLRGGWLHTGDLGYFDKDGFLFLTGRIKNIIISCGINIYPEEIEHVLLQHKCVADVIVIGKEHRTKGEIPIAKVVLKSTISENELKNYCKQKLADYKVPQEFEFIDYLPKTYNGKNTRFK